MSVSVVSDGPSAARLRKALTVASGRAAQFGAVTCLESREREDDDVADARSMGQEDSSHLGRTFRQTSATTKRARR